MRNGKRLICWDLDNTLVFFKKHGEMGMIPGIRPMVEGLRRQGIANVITTAAPDRYPQYVLGGFGMADLFDGIFSRDDLILDESYTKSYAAVARAFGIEKSEASRRMLVIGNSERDASVDLDIAFVMHPFSERYSARIYSSVLSGLSGLSHSWAEAHSMMMDNASQTIALPHFEGGLAFVDGIPLAVGYSRWNPGPPTPPRRFIGVLDVPERPGGRRHG